MTELSPVATLLTPADHADEAAGALAPAGPPPHAEVRIVDEDDVEVPRGHGRARSWSAGGHVMLGYWNKPEETAEALRGGWMHTGDGGYLDDEGYVFVVDRIKDMIITGGENVYSVEVENALAQHPAVATCAVIGVPDERVGRAGARRRRAPARRDGHRRRTAGARPRARSPATRSRAAWSSWTRCRSRPRARCSSANCGRPTGVKGTAVSTESAGRTAPRRSIAPGRLLGK